MRGFARRPQRNKPVERDGQKLCRARAAGEATVCHLTQTALSFFLYRRDDDSSGPS